MDSGYRSRVGQWLLGPMFMRVTALTNTSLTFARSGMPASAAG